MGSSLFASQSELRRSCGQQRSRAGQTRTKGAHSSFQAAVGRVSVRGVNKMEGKAKSVCDVFWVQLVSSTFKNSCSLTPLRENPPFVGRCLSSDSA